MPPGVSQSALYGSLGFRPDGHLVTLADHAAGGLDSSLPAPGVIAVKQRGNLSYPLRTATRLRFNRYTGNTPPEEALKGFIYTAGSIDISFFEDIRVIAQFTPNDPAAPVHLTGSDATEPALSWNIDGKNFFNDTTFDSSNRGYPADVTLGQFRAGIDNTNQYRIHVRKDWRKLLAFTFPMKWDAGTRQLIGLPKNDLDLKVIKAQAQVKKLDATGAEITFGASFEGLPNISTESITRLFTDGVESLTGYDKKLADGLSSAVTSQLNNAFLKQARTAVDNLLADTLTNVVDAPLTAAADAVLAGPFNQLYGAIAASYDNAGTATYRNLDASIDAANTQAQTIINLLRNNLATAGSPLLNATDQLQSITQQIAARLEDADKGLEQLENLIRTTPGGNIENDLLYKLTREVLKQVLSDVNNPVVDYLADAGSAAIANKLKALLKDLLSEAQPTLTEVADTIGRARSVIGQLRVLTGSAVEAQAAFAEQIRKVLNQPAKFGNLCTAAMNAFKQELKNSRDTAKNFINENSEAALRQRFIRFLLTSFHASELGTELRVRLIKLVDPIRTAFNQALDTGLAELNNMINEVVLTLVKEASLAVVTPVLQTLKDGVANVFNKESQAETLPNEYGKAGTGSPTDKKVMVMAKVQGYVRTKGDTLDFLRVDGEVGLKVPDGIEFKGYYQIKNFENGTPSVSCRGSGTGGSTGSVQTEISMGATLGISFAAGGDSATKKPGDTAGAPPKAGVYFKLTVDAKFSLDNTATIIGFDGLIDLQTNLIDFGGVSVSRITLSVGIGQGEAYIFGGAKGSFWLLELDVDMYAGITKQVAVLKRGLDPQSFETYLGAPAGPCLSSITIGFAARAAGRISLNRFFQIPDTCLFSLNAGLFIGNSFLIYPSGASYRAGFGQRQGYTISGDILCLLGFDAELGMFYAGTIPLPVAPGQPFTLDTIASVLTPGYIASAVLNLEATAHGWAEVCVDLLLFEGCARLDLIGTLKVSETPPIKWKVEF
jgi:hypothetical protein